MRENASAKARRLLTEGRLTLRILSDDLIQAEVRGDSARVHVVEWTPAGWACPCDAIAYRCSHVQAVQLIILEPTHEGGHGVIR